MEIVACDPENHGQTNMTIHGDIQRAIVILSMAYRRDTSDALLPSWSHQVRVVCQIAFQHLAQSFAVSWMARDQDETAASMKQQRCLVDCTERCQWGCTDCTTPSLAVDTDRQTLDPVLNRWLGVMGSFAVDIYKCEGVVLAFSRQHPESCWDCLI